MKSPNLPFSRPALGGLVLITLFVAAGRADGSGAYPQKEVWMGNSGNTSILANPAVPNQTDVRGNETVNDWKMSGRVFVALEKNAFRAGEDVRLFFTIQNRGNRIITIYPSQIPLRTFRPNIRTKKNRTVALKDGGGFLRPHYKGRHLQMENSPDNYEEEMRAVSLYPGEAYTKTINLSRYYALEPGESYFVRGYFYPDFNHNPRVFSRSDNVLSFQIYESDGMFAETRRPETVAPRPAAASISPDETVFLFLTAEFKKNWPNYLKYINLKEYIRAYNRFARDYIDAGPAGRGAILEDFKKFLTRDREAPLTRFKISQSREKVPGRVVEVDVDIERENNRFPLRYRYTYQLEKTPGVPFWRITYLTVKVQN